MANYMPGGRLGQLIVRGNRLKSDVGPNMVSGSIELSTSEATSLTLSVLDPTLSLTASRVMTKGGTVDYLALRLLIQSDEVTDNGSGTPQLNVVARSAGVRKLRRDKGKKVWQNISPGALAKQLGRKAGLRVVAQSSSRRKQIKRGRGQSSWKLLEELAGEEQFLCFEAEGVLFFGRPTWLLARGKSKAREVVWSARARLGSEGLTAVPTCRRSEDSKRGAAEIEVQLMGAGADVWRPGHVMRLRGVPTFNGYYLVTSVSIPLDNTQPVVIRAVTPEDPAAVEAGGGSSSAGTGSGKTVEKFVQAALGQVGDRYVWGAEASKSDPDPDAFDCSELVEWAAGRAGVKFVDGSAAQLAYCRSKGKTISVERAIKTRGALLFARGHVAISLGDGRTVEAANRTYGVTKLNARGRQSVTWIAGGLIPGMDYGRVAK